MKLHDVVTSIVMKNKVSAKDIENTIMFLVDESVLEDVATLRRIAKKINSIMEYEDESN